jgi:uncharacterized DUF497 family protein
MEFEWDEANRQHIAEHGLTPDEVEFALYGFTFDIEYQDWYDEERFAEVGVTARSRYLTIITTWRGDRIRVVTAFDATPALIEEYLRRRGNLWL